jgi:MFS family permease
MATNQNTQGPRSGSSNNNQSSKHEEPSSKLELPLVETQLVGSVRSVRFWLTMAWLGFLIFITSVDSIVIGAVLPIIAHDLHATTNIAFLCGTSFLIAQAAVPTLYGSFSECFGRRTCMLIAIAIFLLASILCATAQNITWLVAARVVSNPPGHPRLSLQSGSTNLN